MTRSPIGIGLIGVGRHGIRYARHILEDVPNARLAAVCRQHLGQGLGLPGGESVRVYGDAPSLIADPAVDVVIAVVPPVLSRDICLQAVLARKPILIEKPLSISAEHARVMVEAASRAGVPFMTGQTLRFDSTIHALREKRALIGRSERLVLTSCIETKTTRPDHADGYGKRGALLEIGVHMLDLARFLTGEEAHEARCTLDVMPPISPETRASIRLTMDGGTDCLIEVARVQAGRVGTASWKGAEGELTADWTQQRVRWWSRSEAQDWTFPPCPTVLATIRAFLRAVETQTPMIITGEDGYRAVEIAEACYRSARTGASVSLPLSY